MKCNHRVKSVVCPKLSALDQFDVLESKRHVWEGIITRVNGQVDHLQKLGIFHSSIVLGPIVMRRHYGIDGPSDVAEIVQAGLSSDCGLVAIFWDTDALHEATDAGSPVGEWDAVDRSRPLSECSPIIRWLVAKHSKGLLEELLRTARVIL